MFLVTSGIILVLSVSVLFFLRPRRPTETALAAMESTDRVTVQWSNDGQWLTFGPRVGLPTGFIFYPGSNVRPEAYAVLMQGIAERGFFVVIPKMPANMSVFGWKEAAAIMTAWPDIENWAIGGHSLGGVMSARFVMEYPEEMDGLVFWASYPAGSWDLSGVDLPVMSIYGSLDGLSSVEDVMASKPNLPPETHWVELEGGNHAQFGNYGSQPGDQPASILTEDQQKQVVEATVQLLREISETNL